MSVEPDQYQPALGWWSHLWRFAAVIGISALGMSGYVPQLWRENPAWLAIDVAIGLVSLGLVAQRRRHPLTVALLVNAATAFSLAAGGPAILALVSLATRRRWREIIPTGLVAILAGLTIYAFVDEAEPFALWMGIIVLMVGVTIAWGMYIGSRRELLATLRERAHRAEDDQASRIEQARVAERTRIAREMHDVLAHRISIVSMHAGALAYRDDLGTAQMREALAIIQESSHQALIELRDVLGVLRGDPGDATPELPQPTAVDLSELIERSTFSGARIDLDDDLDLDGMPDAVGRTVYRVVQEGLTNAAKHAPDTRITVVVAGRPQEGVRVEVRNPLRIGTRETSPPASGLGLIGLTERVELLGGRLGAFIAPDGEFTLTAWIPWPL